MGRRVDGPVRADAIGWAGFALVVAVYLSFAASSLDLPGLHYDEVFDPVYGMELALGLPSSTPGWSATIGCLKLPLGGLHPYDYGIFAIYWSALAFLAAGVSATSLRWAAVFVGAGTLLALYSVCRAWFSRPVALAACLLLAVNPAFVLWSRIGFYAIELQTAFFPLAALALFARWHRTRSSASLYAGAFLLGSTFNVSVKALYFLLLYPVVAALFVLREERPSSRQALWAAFWGLAGALPFLAYNATHGLPLVRALLGSFLGTSPGGVDNTAFLHNVGVRLGQLSSLLMGLPPFLPPAEVAVFDKVTPAAFAASLAVLGASCARGAMTKERRLLCAVLSFTTMMFLATFMSPHHLTHNQLLVLWPYPMLIIALGLERLRRWAEPRRPGLAWAAPAAAFALLLFSSARTSRAHFAELTRTGGVGLWSDSSSELARYLEERGIAEPVCLHWGIARNLYALSSGRLRPVEAHHYMKAQPAEREAAFSGWLARPSNRYLSFEGSFPRPARYLGDMTVLEGLARRKGLRLVVEAEFKDRAGGLVFRVHRAQRA